MSLQLPSIDALSEGVSSFLASYGYFILFGGLLWQFWLLPKLRERFPYTIGGEMREERKRELDKCRRAAVEKLQMPKSEHQEATQKAHSNKETQDDSKAYLRPKAYSTEVSATETVSPVAQKKSRSLLKTLSLLTVLGGAGYVGSSFYSLKDEEFRKRN
ncbi:hypothetical protein K493DRAFT_410367 [Basidiobolus meristosporus CBS 931.73]|uniref:Uncharacterized protein n=1 Tax=Basidiobolus meristosporus CBS 931.73 TaxID=1314790 RepID=A0A1Y1XUT5_9FUNG|nr:hypothetical protein K493DRAFT_410367 [Basidiobolus meristosporus CBS 931.73]|eukprot:ORX89519.1 hypothetical protein K493DRAFT_410367 [Basidiobolus meristosporus CBS 931.73]